jgi:hypothetical protein
LVTCSTCSLTLKMKSIHSCETSVNFCETTWCRIPEDSKTLCIYDDFLQLYVSCVFQIWLQQFE